LIFSLNCCSDGFGARYCRGWQSGWQKELARGIAKRTVPKAIANRELAKEEFGKIFGFKSFLEKNF
jgi:hypothetical protein